MNELSNLDKSEHWQKIVNKYKQSGLSQREFSHQEGISKNRLSYWVNKFRKFKAPSNFVEIASQANPETRIESSVELEFPSGVILRIKG